MRLGSKTLSTLIVTFVAVSCATARTVKIEPGEGGVVATHRGIFGDADADAAKIMVENCAGKYQITEEGEAVVGQMSQSSGDQNGTRRTGLHTSSSTSTQDVTEWRKTYRCVN